MANSWEILDDKRAGDLEEVPDKKRCPEHLASIRCLLKLGHDGQHKRGPHKPKGLR